MASVFDVAAYILKKQGAMTTMKLQKLVYYAKAWHMVWTGSILFPQEFEAWANGPVVRDLYFEHRHMFKIDSIDKGDATNLSEDEKESIDGVLSVYGAMQPYELIDQTHSEAPWKDARGNTPAGESSNAKISDGALYDYYAFQDDQN